ncbi:MAG: sulfatase-like hydrolase/transferase [Halioglobus sp.]
MFRLTATSLLLLFFYAAVFYASADTPIAEASAAEWFQVFILTIGISLTIALLFQVIFSLITAAFKSSQSLESAVGMLTAFTILFCLALMVLENFTYTVFSIGLKTTTSALIKLAMLASGCFVAYQCLGIIRWMARKFSPAIYLPLFLLTCLTLLVGKSVLPGEGHSDYTDNEVRRRPGYLNIILLTGDGLNAEAMSVYGNATKTTPFLDSVAQEFMIFDNAFSNAGNTTGGITALLTGRSPIITQVVYPPDILKRDAALKSLPALLPRKHYLRTQWSVPHYASADSQNMIGAFEIVNGRDQSTFDFLSTRLELTSMQSWFLGRLIKDQLSVLLDALFVQEMLNPFMQVAETDETVTTLLNDRTRISGLIESIANAQQANKKLFNQTHLMRTHGAKFYAKRIFAEGKKQDKEWMPAFYFDAIVEFDGRVETVYKHLEESGILDETILVISADHGQAWDTKRRIPLMIRLPKGENAGIYNSNVQIVDIAPTILDYIGITPPKWMSGISLLSPQKIPVERVILAASVKGAEKGEKGFIRSHTEKRFNTANSFLAIHCGEYTTFTFPDPQLVFSPLGNQSSPDRCNTISKNQKVKKIFEAYNSLAPASEAL